MTTERNVRISFGQLNVGYLSHEEFAPSAEGLEFTFVELNDGARSCSCEDDYVFAVCLRGLHRFSGARFRARIGRN